MKLASCVLLPLLLLSGCIMLSINPLSKENECVLPGLEGAWVDEKGTIEYDICLSDDGKLYSYVERKGNRDVHRRSMTLAKVGDSVYASSGLSGEIEIPSEIQGCVLPLFQIYLLKLDGDKLHPLSYDAKGSGKDFPEPPFIEYVDPISKDGEKVHIYGADPAKLREWLAKYGEKAFTLGLPLKRKAKPEPAK